MNCQDKEAWNLLGKPTTNNRQLTTNSAPAKMRYPRSVEIEAVILTGGRSSRMGEDKSMMLVDGEPSASRIQRLIEEQGIPVTVLGPGGIEDQIEYGGPLLALFSFMPTANSVFVCSCDLPGFEPKIIHFLTKCLEGSDAVIPEVGGRTQPLCALYSREAFFALHDAVQSGARSMRIWVERLSVRSISESEMMEAGIAPESTLGANTPEEWTERTADFRKLQNPKGP